MGAIILDSSVLIAFLNSSDKHHMAAKSAIEASNSSFKISILTVSEVLVKASGESEKERASYLPTYPKSSLPSSPLISKLPSLPPL